MAPWPKGKKYASVNNFGFGGTNVHVIMGRPPSLQSLDSANGTPTQATSIGAQDERRSARYVYAISAPTKRALGAVAKNVIAIDGPV